MVIICLILVGAAGCESKSKSSSQPPTQEQQAPIDGNDQQQAPIDGNDQQQTQPLSQKAITAFKAFNNFQNSFEYTTSECVYYNRDNSCLTNEDSFDADNKIEIPGITENNFEPNKLAYSNDEKYYYYMYYHNAEDKDPAVSLSLFTGNTIPYLDTNEEQSLNPPFSVYQKGDDLTYVFIADEFDINESTTFPKDPISMKHGAMIVYESIYRDQTKEEVKKSTDDEARPSHVLIEFHVTNDDNTTSIYSTGTIAESSTPNTHLDLTDENGTVVGSLLWTKVYPIEGKTEIYHKKIEFYDTNKKLF